MKTTVDIPDPLFEEIKRLAARRKTTIKVLVETSLRQFLATEKKSRRSFKLRSGAVDGHGVHAGLAEGDWPQLRAVIYEGRGG